MTKGRIYAIISTLCYMPFAIGGAAIGIYMLKSLQEVVQGPQESGSGDVAAILLFLALLGFVYAAPGLLAFFLKFINIFTRGKILAVLSMIFGFIYILIHGISMLFFISNLANYELLGLLILFIPFAVSLAAFITNILSIKYE